MIALYRGGIRDYRSCSVSLFVSYAGSVNHSFEPLANHRARTGAASEASARARDGAIVHSEGQGRPHGGHQNLELGDAAEAEEGGGAEGENSRLHGVQQKRREGKKAGRKPAGKLYFVVSRLRSFAVWCGRGVHERKRSPSLPLNSMCSVPGSVGVRVSILLRLRLCMI